MFKKLFKKIFGRFVKAPMQKWIEKDEKHLARNYLPLPVLLNRGHGVHLWDTDGTRYLDMMSSYSAVSHGHAHPRILRVLHDQAQQLAMCSRAYHSTTLGPFADKLAELTGLDLMLPMNTGAEAVETAVKAARQWGYVAKGIPEDKAEIIVADGNFHGRTTTVISFSTEESYRRNFGPFTPGFVTAPYGDLDAFTRAITPNTAAILIEPIQGEAGIKLPPEGFIKGLRDLCDRNNVLLIIDEVQSGLGRTGKMFCFQHDDVKPDVLILGKALGGGVLPVSAIVGTKEVIGLFKPGSHGSTFGGNPLACAVGLEALTVLEEENLVENSAEMGAYLLSELQGIRSSLITAVRGRGLWVGVDIDPAKISARKICEMMAKEGVLSKETHETVIRFAPPLTITKDDIDHAVMVFRKVLNQAG